MALVDDRTLDMAEKKDKKVFLVAAFHNEHQPEPLGPVTGTAVDVVAVIGMAGDDQRFEWVGPSREESIDNPALVTPVKVRLALPSPWHPADQGVVTGLVQLDSTRLGGGTVDEDIDHLLTELAKSREADADGNTDAEVDAEVDADISAEIDDLDRPEVG